MSTLFISDLHLDPTRPAVTRAFFNFLENEALQADAVYILGDLFEVWIGDDDDAPLVKSCTEAFRQFTNQGIPLYIMLGNRDFLMGEQFFSSTGCLALPDPSVVDLYGQNVLLMHGDTLCTDDVDYLAFREQSRTEQWKSALLTKPLAERRLIAQQMRKDSMAAASNKAANIMDVNHQEVAEQMQQHKVQLLVHGHTHRPARHNIQLNNGVGERIVLGDWHDKGWVLEIDQNHSRSLRSFPII